MNEETLKNLSREEAINYLDNQMDYTYQLQKRIDKAIKFIEDEAYVNYEMEMSHNLYEGEIFELLKILKGNE